MSYADKPEGQEALNAVVGAVWAMRDAGADESDVRDTVEQALQTWGEL